MSRPLPALLMNGKEIGVPGDDGEIVVEEDIYRDRAQFVHDNPKDVDIPRNCVQVPWVFYSDPVVSKYKSYADPNDKTTYEWNYRIRHTLSSPPLIYYLANVVSDR